MNTADVFYRAPVWLPGGHAQTIYPAFVPRPAIRYRRQRIDTPDGDFVDFDWLESAEARAVSLFRNADRANASRTSTRVLSSEYAFSAASSACL